MEQTTLARAANETYRQFVAILEEGGPRASLAYLLGLSTYRFIAIFRFHDGMANAAVFLDRENPEVLSLNEVPETATYCCYVRDRGELFSTANSLLDARLSGHVSRNKVLSYCGIPVMSPEGVIEGTLCHYDNEPRDPAQLDLELLIRVASKLQQGRHIPPYRAN